MATLMFLIENFSKFIRLDAKAGYGFNDENFK
jgi:hypothetical protein